MQALLTQGALDLLDIKIVRILHIFRVVVEHKKYSFVYLAEENVDGCGKI